MKSIIEILPSTMDIDLRKRSRITEDLNLMKKISELRELKEREVVRKIGVNKQWTWFVQAMLEDTHLVSVSLGEDSTLTIFYDLKVEDQVNKVLETIQDFVRNH